MTGKQQKGNPVPREELRRAAELLKSGKLQAADELCRDILERDQTNCFALNYRGVIAGQRGDLRMALRLLLNAVASNPGYVEALVNLGTAQMATGEPEQAVQNFARADELDGGNAAIRYTLGNAHFATGNHDAALASYNEALKLKPDLVDAHINKGIALLETGKLEPAEDSFRKALTFNLNSVAALNNLGVVLNKLERSEEALQAYEAVLQMQPNHKDAAYNKLSLLQRLNRVGEARDFLPEAYRILGDHPGARLVEARLLQQAGQAEAALALLDTAEPPRQLAPAWAYEQGKLCDALSRVEQAFGHFLCANRLSAKAPDKGAVSTEREGALLDRLQNYFPSLDIQDWRSEDLEGPSPSVAFAVGFPRSGTTLLDQALRGASGVEVMSEVPALDAVKQHLEHYPGGFPDALGNLDSGAISELRDLYFEKAWRKAARRQDALLVDRMALNIRQIGLIHRLFPDARIVHVLRHPCDVVLSAFMQNFRYSDVLSHFLDLREAALYYDRVMRLWDIYREVLPLRVHELRYESLVADFEGEIVGVLDFLGLEWDDSIGEFDRRSRSAGRINTPSYRQVAQPLYRSARYRWEKYSGQMAEILPILEPHIARFGYEGEKDSGHS